ncbi:hypothetical protein FZEAL_4543 [Fusarium zealandicum]|uniref:Phosphatidylethanolamine-binding protein n=1 Tax=Fusarium zealandicum TaxID=1053134 RepID=A0A8H4UMD3_9HYPO|nr:hypothetical protein FZEAL_4543 [Fusarium zealandicum]
MSSFIKQALALASDDDVNKLTLEYNGKKLTRGDNVPKDDAASPPQLNISSVGKGPYMAICVDLDAPYVTFPLLSPIVHWIQPGMQPNEAGILEYPGSCVVDWLQPTPPPLSGPHRYVFILFEQPSTCDTSKLEQTFDKPVGVAKRVRWDMDQWVKEAGLGGMVAATWFNSA